MSSVIREPVNTRPWFLHPGFVFYTTWSFVWLLYSMRLSSVLLYTTPVVSQVEKPLLLGFLPFLLLPYLIPHRTATVVRVIDSTPVDLLLARRLYVWLIFWICSTIAEIVVSGGVPLVWTLTGSSKNYFMFGIPTFHGFLNGLIMAISITRFTLGLRNKRKKDLMFPLLTMTWALVVETRQMIIILLLECAFLFLMYRRLRLKRVFAGLGVVIAFVILFGISGDIRSGGEAFRSLAQPTDRYPHWLPSGFLWVYIYMTTPLNNLVNTFMSVRPLDDFTMPNTFGQLIPTAVRRLLGLSSDITTWTGELVTEAFNVSTAYVGPVQDMGLWGVAGFSGFAGLITGVYWLKRGMRSNLIFAVLCQCLFLTIFYNHFFFLPIITQILWFYTFFRGIGRKDSTGVQHRFAQVSSTVNGAA